MSKKLISMLLVLVMMLSLMTACGNETVANETTDPASTENNAETQGTVGEEAALPYEGVELEFWLGLEGTPDVTKTLELAAAFSEETGVKFNFTHLSSGDRNQMLPTALEAGDDVDLFMVASAISMVNFKDYCYDLTEMAAAANYADHSYPIYVQTAIDECGFLAGIACAPYFNSWWYNAAAFEAAGITEAPSTMEEFEAACDALIAAGYQPIALDSAYAGSYFSQHFERYLGAAGVEELSLNGGWADNALAVEAADELIDWVKKGYFAEGAPDEYPNSQNKIGLTQDVAMVFCGTWISKEIEDAAGVDLEWGTFAYPVAEGKNGGAGSSVFANYYCINKNCTEQEAQAAFDWLMYWKTGANDQAFSEVARAVPCDPNNTELGDLVGSKDVILATTEYYGGVLHVANSDLSTSIGDVVYKIYSGEYASGAEAMAAMDALYG